MDEKPRPGRPRSLSPSQVAEIKALACELPAESGRPLSRDPNFAEKAGRVLDLYRRRWEGRLLPPATT